MDYKSFNDNELISLSLENNEDATNLLIEKYKNTIFKVLKEIIKKYNIRGMEISDLYQEGLIGLLTAIETFNENKDVLFYTYALACVRSQIYTIIRRTFANKNRILNNSYSLDMLYNDTEDSLYEFVKDDSIDPNNILMSEENYKEFIGKIRQSLSNSESSIFELKISGLKNEEIADVLDKDKKSIENSISRIYKKIRQILDNK